nr:DUF3857 domain-containing protein [uncultured Brevundimonas sp.]
MAFEGEVAKGELVAFAPPGPGFGSRPVDLRERDPFGLSERGVCYILLESLTDLTGPAPAFSSRLVQQVTGSDGLQPTASFEIVFDPAFERVIIHTASVLREGVRREAASPAAFELLRRELNLERAIYDGRLTAHMIIPDVRIGDIVETSYTIVGANPVLGGRFSRHQSLQWSAPLVEVECRVKAPVDRILVHRGLCAPPDLEETIEGGVRQWRWHAFDVARHAYDRDTPAWWIGHTEVHIGDRLFWSDIADLFRDFYSPPSTLPPELDAAITELATRYPRGEDRMVEALRFVQRLLRYHSVGIGAGGFKPRAISDIWTSRYGDCKDASYLLTVILGRLGVEACPALVNTVTGRGLKETLPNATAFDHCIVRAEVDGCVRWLDATMAPQAGTADSITKAGGGWALPLKANAALDLIPEPTRQVVLEVFEEWTFKPMAADPAELKLRSVYRGWRADDMRRWGENEGFESVSRRLREGLEHNYGELSELNPLTWTDDRNANEIELIEHYSVSRPFVVNDGDDTGVRFESMDDVVGPTLTATERARRDQPIHIGAPRIVRTERTFNFPIRPHVTPWEKAFAGPGVRGLSKFEWLDSDRARHLIEVDVAESVVAAEQAQDYFAFLRKMRAFNGVSFVLNTRKGRLKGPDNGETTWRSWFVVGGIVAVLVLLRIFSP